MSDNIEIISVYMQNADNMRAIQLPDGRFHKSHPKFQFIFRVDSIVKNIRMSQADIVGLCELDNAGRDLIIEKLSALGYTCQYGQYSPGDERTFNFVIGYTDKFKYVSHRMIWFTSTPEIPLKDENRPAKSVNDNTHWDPVLALQKNSEFEKGSLITIFESASGRRFLVSVNHFGLQFPYNKISSEVLFDRVEKIKIEYNVEHVIIGGDFNTFGFENSKSTLVKMPRELEIFAGKYKRSNPQTSSTAEPIGFTFVGHCYDLGLGVDPSVLEKFYKLTNVQEQRVHLGEDILRRYPNLLRSVLDHVLYCGFTEMESRILIPSNLCEPDLTEQFKKSYIEGMPMAPSDHMPIFVTMRF